MKTSKPKIDYAAMERQDALDPAPAGHWWVRDINGSNRRLVTLAEFRAEIEVSKAKATVAFRASAAR
jgi:hypothetical protein